MADAAEPKHRSLLTYKGLSYRYDKTYGEFHLIDKHTSVEVPKTIRSGTVWLKKRRAQGWEAGGAYGATPLGSLEAWCRSMISYKKREAAEAEQAARGHRAEVRRLGARSWKKRAPTKT